MGKKMTGDSRPDRRFVLNGSRLFNVITSATLSTSLSGSARLDTLLESQCGLQELVQSDQTSEESHLVNETEILRWNFVR